MDFGFGKPSAIPLSQLMEMAAAGGGGGGGVTGLGDAFDAIYEYLEQIIEILEGKVDIEAFNKWYSDFIANAWLRKLTVVEQLLIPSWT